MSEKIVILGAGQMGTAFAQYLAKQGYPVTLWMRRQEQYQSIKNTGYNEQYLPGVQLDENISCSLDIESSLKDSKLIVLAIPSSAINEFLNDYGSYFSKINSPVILSTIKGLPEGEKVDRVSNLISNVIPHSDVAVLSGPNIAKEIALGLPTTTTIACQNESVLNWLVSAFDSNTLKVYPSSDLIGTELCGSLKNVVTVAVGLVDGLNLGENVKGVVVASGFYEIGRLIESSGGARETRFSPAGLEDLLVASYSGRSRNYRLGKMLGEGKSLSEIEDEFGHITFEGIKTARLTWKLAKELGVSTPLINCVYELITGKASAEEAFNTFWSSSKDLPR